MDAPDERAALLDSCLHFAALDCGPLFAELRSQVDALAPSAERAVCLVYLGQIERTTRDLTLAPPSGMRVAMAVPEPLRGHLLAFAELARARAEAASIERALLARLRTPPPPSSMPASGAHAALVATPRASTTGAAQSPAPAQCAAPRLALVRDALPAERGSEPGVFPAAVSTDHASTVAPSGDGRQVRS